MLSTPPRDDAAELDGFGPLRRSERLENRLDG
jgi:hypothetical protein